MADVTDEIANRPAPGRANPIGASYMHVVLGEDRNLNGRIRQVPLLATSSFAGRPGVDKLPPPPGTDLGEWYHTVTVELAPARQYARAVFEASEEFVGSLTEQDLARTIDMSFTGLGILPLALWVDVFLTAHCNNLAGEISALKGVFGLKGYPF